MHFYLKDHQASAFVGLGVVALVIGAFLFLGNELLIKSGAKTDPRDRRAEAVERFDAGCKRHGGTVFRDETGADTTPSCTREFDDAGPNGTNTILRIPLVEVGESDAEDSAALVARSGTVDRKQAAANRGECRDAVRSWRRSRADDRRYGINLTSLRSRPRFIRKSLVCYHPPG